MGNLKKFCYSKNEIFVDLLELYMSVFKWEELPDLADERFMEYSLAYSNQIVFYKNDLMGYLCLKSSKLNAGDVNGNPTLVLATGRNGFTEQVDTPENGVVIFDNKTRISPISRLWKFAERMADMEITIDINIHHQKTPRIYKADKKTIMTLKNYASQAENYEEHIFLDEGILKKTNGELDMILKPAPFVADKIRIEKQKLKSEVLTFMGIESNASEKKERSLAGEVEVSQGEAKAKFNTRFRERQKGVDKINKLFSIKPSIKVLENKEVTDRGSSLFKDFEDEQKTEEVEEVEE